jgi:hypothetical protein
MKTVWRPGKVLKSWAKAAMLGIVLIPTIIIAEPTAGVGRDSDTFLILHRYSHLMPP